MNLWIRSQDKESLLLINTMTVANDDSSVILGYGIDGKIKLPIGRYKSKERVLEVLDDIQNIINAKTIIKFKGFVPQEKINYIKEAIDSNRIIELPDYEIKQLAGLIVYEMPSE